MTEFDQLKNGYIAIIQLGLSANVGCQQAKQGNDILHKVCENFINNSWYNDTDKTTMKQELELLKETLSNELEDYYQHG